MLMMVEDLTSSGHTLKEVLSYTLPQALTLHATMQYRQKNEDIGQISSIRLGVMMSKAEAKDFDKVIKEIEDGD